MTIRAVPLANGGAIARLCPMVAYTGYCEDRACDHMAPACHRASLNQRAYEFALVCLLPKDHPVMIAQAIVRDSKLN